MIYPKIDFGKLVEESMSDNMNIYAAGHKEGYRLGFSDGVHEAKKIIDEYIASVTVRNNIPPVKR